MKNNVKVTRSLCKEISASKKTLKKEENAKNVDSIGIFNDNKERLIRVV